MDFVAARSVVTVSGWRPILISLTGRGHAPPRIRAVPKVARLSKIKKVAAALVSQGACPPKSGVFRLVFRCALTPLGGDGASVLGRIISKIKNGAVAKGFRRRTTRPEKGILHSCVKIVFFTRDSFDITNLPSV